MNSKLPFIFSMKLLMTLKFMIFFELVHAYIASCNLAISSYPRDINWETHKYLNDIFEIPVQYFLTVESDQAVGD